MSCKDTEDRAKWITCLHEELKFLSLRCNASNVQLGAYLMKKLESYCKDNGDLPKKFTIVRTGLQPIVSKGYEDSCVWVFNQDVHINEHGRSINPVDSPYYWSKQFNYLAAQNLATAKKKSSLKRLVHLLKECYIENTPAVLLTLGAQVLCLHYEELNRKGNFSVPATVLIGKVNAGKSTACRATLSMLGIHESNFISSITDSKAKALTSSTTLGVVFDDPKDASDIADKILHHFDMGKACSQNATYEPHCTFITSLNDDCLSKLTKMHPK